MYKIYGTSKFGSELIDEADTLKEAEFLLSEYRMAFGSSYVLWIK